ncbi:hypothetical protein BDV12DRAFT_174094 [Aspergillus spectabilis]
MEAAGIMKYLPCLVIRGICDYCESHKEEMARIRSNDGSGVWEVTAVDSSETAGSHAASRYGSAIRMSLKDHVPLAVR